MQEKSLIEYAYEYISNSKTPVSFKELFDAVIKESGLKLTQAQLKAKLGSFYAQLSTDGRFLMLEGNTWDLRSRYAYTGEVDFDLDYDEEDDEEDSEERELLRKELGEEEDDDSEVESDDLDFDKPQNVDDDEGDF